MHAIADADDVPIDGTQLEGVIDGLPFESLMRTLSALAKADFIDGVLVEPDQSDYPVRAANLRLTEKGKVATGVWPAREAIAEAFVRSLLTAADRESDPVQRSRLQALAGAASAVGASVLSTVLGQLAEEGIRHL